MNEAYLFQARVTGILVEHDRILLARQGFPGQGGYMGDKRNIGLGI